jgi:hypothetical protein
LGGAEEALVAGERCERDRDEGNASRIRREAGAQGRDVRQAASPEIGRQGLGQLGLAAAIVGERQEVNGDPAGLPLRQGFPERLEGAPIGLSREELVPRG